MGLTARLRRSWPDEGLQLGPLRPQAGRVVLLDWQTGAELVEGGAPPPVAAAVAAALVRLGTVAFRWAGEPAWPADQATVVRMPRPGIARAALERMAGRWRSDLVLTRHAGAAAALFDHGWELQGQAALVLDGDTLSEELRAGLATRDDWRDFGFPPPALLLVAPAVDGDAALLAARTEEVLDRVTGALRDALAGANVPLDAADA